MEAMRKTWTDERVDDLNGRVSDGFHRVDEDIRDLRGELRDLRSDMNMRFDRVDARFDSMQRVMLQSAIALSASFVAGFATLAGLIVTH